MKQAFKMFMGSLLVYLAVASCVGMDVPNLSTSSAGGGGSDGTSGRTASSSSMTAGGHGGMSTGNGGSTGSVLNPVPPAQAESGTRLKATYTIGADGSKSYHDGYWWDSLRQENCVMLPVDETTDVCIPFYEASAAPYFQDALCTIATWRLSGSEAQCNKIPTYAYWHQFDSCGTITPYTIYAIGEPISLVDVYTNIGGDCIKSMQNGAVFHALTAIPTSAFVTASHAHE